MAAISPIQFFNTAHKRAEDFLGLKAKGRKPDDDLRAAVVFAVSAIDAYFHIKIIKHFREKQKKEGTFQLPPAAQELIRGVVAKKLTGSEYRDLSKDKQKLINTACTASDASLFSYLEEALSVRSFQSIGDMSRAMEIMGKTSAEVWGRFDTSTKLKVKIKKKGKGGRPPKPKVGKKIDAKVQLKSLFERRQKIIHQADTPLLGQRAGKPTRISSSVVRKWLKSSKDAIHRIDKAVV